MIINITTFKKFLLNLQKGDYKAINRALTYIAFKFVGLVLALPIVVVLWILKPFFWFKVGKLHHGRIGHLAIETDLFLRKRQLGKFPDGPFYCFVCDSRGIANRQLLKMFKRVLRVYESRVLTALFDGMLPLFKSTPFYQPLGLQNNEYTEFNNGKPTIFFTLNEIQKGRELLKNMNVDFDNDNYVCIFSRDNAFLNKTMGFKNWDYHDHRNADIDDFIEAVKYLIDKGLTVIRIGSIVKKPISYSHPRLIDYSVSEHQSEFLDIFLIGTCKFFLGTSSGIGEIALLFDVPRLNVGMVEFGVVPTGKNCLYIPKKYKLAKTGQYLHFNQALDMKLDHYFRNAQELGIEAEDNSPEDILKITKEMYRRLEGNFRYSVEEEKLMQSFKKLLSQSDVVCKDVPTPIGIEWLKENKDLYFLEKDLSG